MSPSEFFASLLQNLTLGLSLTWVYSYSIPLLKRFSLQTQALIQGVIFGAFAVIAIVTADQFVDGYSIDGRGAMVAISSMFGGPISGIITTLIVCVFRAALGGGGVLTSVVASLTTAALGLIFYYRYWKPGIPLKIRHLFVLGVTLALQILFWIALLGGEEGRILVSSASPAVLVYYPTAIILFGILLSHQHRSLEIRQTLEQERYLLRTLIDQLPDYIFVKDAKLRFVASNTAHAQAVNITRIEDMIGKSAAQLFPAELAGNFEADDRRVLETGEPLINAERITTDANGNKRWVLTTKIPFRDVNGEIGGIVGISRDITERKIAEEALRTSEEQFRSSFDHAAIGMAQVGMDGQWVKVNRAMSRLIGYTEDELRRLTFQDITHPDDLEIDLGYVQQLLKGEIVTYQMEKRYIHKREHFVWVQLNVTLVRDSDGKPLHFISQIQDIGAEREAQAALSEERNLLRTLIDHLPDNVFVKDANERFIMINSSHTTSTGKTTAEVIGKTSQEIFASELANQFHEDDLYVLRTGQPLINVERRIADPENREKWGLTTKVALRDQNGQIIGLVGIIRDITERKKADRQAMELALQKENMQVLADFIRDASHDLKTPLTVIQSSLYLLQRSPDPARKQQHAANIEQQVARLAQLIDDQLMTVKLDSSAEFVFESVDLNRVVREVTTSVARLAEHQQLTLTEALTENIPRIQADEEKLIRAMRNLVENAINYTPDGGHITVRTYAADQRVICEVQDTGIGISEHDLPRIFERFFRVDKARSTQTGGSGLGLPIAQKIIKAHGGCIEVESVLGVGSTFRVCLPLTQAAAD